MSGLFKQDIPDGKTPPSKDDERQRLLALKGKEPKGGRATTLLTKGLATPSLKPAGSKTPSSLLTG